MFDKIAIIGGIVAMTCFLGLTGAGMFLKERSDRRLRSARMRRLSGHGAVSSGGMVKPDSRVGFDRIMANIGALVSPRKETWIADLQTKLAAAGYLNDTAHLYFVGTRVVATILLAIIGFTGSLAGRLPTATAVLMGLAGGAFGFLLPSFVLNSQVQRRQRVLRNGLPDALDIMVMCVESGASLNAAISCVTDEIQEVHPALGKEMVTIGKEIHLGLSASEAFRSFADRTGVTDLRDLAAVILQSERHGASIAKALRTFADTARQDRQLRAEEAANKTAVKIVFPTLLCIFPAIFTVLLGPAAFQMAKIFAK